MAIHSVHYPKPLSFYSYPVACARSWTAVRKRCAPACIGVLCVGMTFSHFIALTIELSVVLKKSPFTPMGFFQSVHKPWEENVQGG